MNKKNRYLFCCKGFIVWLLFFLLAGCTTSQAPRVLGRHLENYRKVYLIKFKKDPREVNPRILSRLQLAGFDVTDVPLDTVKSLMKETGEKGLDQPALVCRVGYVSVSDFHLHQWNVFETIEIDFFDLEKGGLVFKVNYFDPHSELPENTELDRLFVQISDKFFPGQPNPFKGKK